MFAESRLDNDGNAPAGTGISSARRATVAYDRTHNKKGSKGYYMMNDEWFDDYVYQAVVKKSSLPKELLSALDADPIVLEPWDPMGTLAR